MQTANESGLCPVCGHHTDSTAHMTSCSTYVGEPKKKTEPETFEAKMQEEMSFSTVQGMVKQDSAVDLCREADQRIDQLTTDLAQARADLGLCAQSAPIELVDLVEELIDWIVGANSAPADPQLVIRAQATIERWKV